jgi:uncharacterized membrane protein YdjX (TVP38/TMEM64 family)
MIQSNPDTGPKGSADNSSSENRALRRLIGPLLFILTLILLGNWLGGRWPEVEAALDQMGPWGYGLYACAFVVLTPLCFPVTVLGVSAGFIFGPWLGFGLHFLSGVIAGSVMYWLGRGLLRGRIKSLLATRPRLAAVDRMVGRRAVRLNILARLSPLNYGLVCYTLASGRSNFRSYLVGLVGNAPSMAAQIWVGVVARQSGKMSAGDLEGSPQRLVILGVGLVFFGLLSWQIGRMVQTAWNETASDDDPTPDCGGTNERTD